MRFNGLMVQSNNGIGIAPAYHEKIFGIFEKLDQTINGVGMGLTMVKRIVEMYGGQIHVESGGEGLGSCFRFTLPEAQERESAECRNECENRKKAAGPQSLQSAV